MQTQHRREKQDTGFRKAPWAGGGQGVGDEVI